MEALPGAVDPEASVVIMNGAPRRQVVWQMPPRAAGAEGVEDAVEDFTHVHLAWPAPGLGVRDQHGDELPLRISQVGRVRLPCHTLLSAQCVLLTHVLNDRIGESERGHCESTPNSGCSPTRATRHYVVSGS